MSKLTIGLPLAACALALVCGCSTQVGTSADKTLFETPVGFTAGAPGEPGRLVSTTDLTTNPDAEAIGSIRSLSVRFLCDNQSASAIVLDAWFSRRGNIRTRDLFVDTSLPVAQWEPVAADETRTLYHAWQSEAPASIQRQFSVPWSQIENHEAIQLTFNPNLDRDETGHKRVTAYLICRPTGEDVFISDLRIHLEVNARLFAGDGVKSPTDGEVVLRLF